jgi:protein involved in polysaccharide export with SLBB domain
MPSAFVLAALTLLPSAAPPALAPAYVIEPPDVLRLGVTSLTPLQSCWAQSSAEQDLSQMHGERLVRPDGTIGLGTYGGVFVAGLTCAEAEAAIERHLARFALEAVVSVQVLACNSKVCYVITDVLGDGEQVYRLPITGEMMVLDAIAGIQGLPAVASTKGKGIWVARRTSEGGGQVLPVDWLGITRDGLTATNYQLLPGDRVYVSHVNGTDSSGAVKLWAPVAEPDR